jgi:hypothetical protein
MTTFKKLIDLFFSIWSNKTLRNFILITIVFLFTLNQCNRISNLKNEIAWSEQNAQRALNNYRASKDSVRTLLLDNGNMVSTIKSYEFDIANLEGEQEALIKRYREALGLNKDLEKINTLLATEIEIKDSLLVDLSVTKIDSLTDLVEFNKFDDFGNGNTRLLRGEMYVYRDSSHILYRDANFYILQEMNLFAAIENIEGQDEIKISTSYPGLTIKDIENINLINTKLNQRNEKTTGWSVGFGIGYGVNLNNNQVISYGPSLGVGLFYSPKWLRF